MLFLTLAAPNITFGISFHSRGRSLRLMRLNSDGLFRVYNCQYPPAGNQRRYVERGVNLEMAEEIKAGGKSSWWRGDFTPNGTRTPVILESMNEGEGQEGRISEHQFS